MPSRTALRGHPWVVLHVSSLDGSVPDFARLGLGPPRAREVGNARTRGATTHHAPTRRGTPACPHGTASTACVAPSSSRSPWPALHPERRSPGFRPRAHPRGGRIRRSSCAGPIGSSFCTPWSRPRSLGTSAGSSVGPDGTAQRRRYFVTCARSNRSGARESRATTTAASFASSAACLDCTEATGRMGPRCTTPTRCASPTLQFRPCPNAERKISCGPHRSSVARALHARPPRHHRRCLHGHLGMPRRRPEASGSRSAAARVIDGAEGFARRRSSATK